LDHRESRFRGKSVLKKLTATGILAAAATGVMLFGGPAEADTFSAHQAAVSNVYPVDGCYNVVPGFYQPSWCSNYAPVTYYPPTTYPPTAYPPTTYYPGYNYGWNRWHGGGWNRPPYHFHH
jgi:hypothetical protein